MAIQGPTLVELKSHRPDVTRIIVAAMYQHLHELVGQIENPKAKSGAQRVANVVLELCPEGAESCTVALRQDADRRKAGHEYPDAGSAGADRLQDSAKDVRCGARPGGTGVRHAGTGCGPTLPPDLPSACRSVRCPIEGSRVALRRPGCSGEDGHAWSRPADQQWRSALVTGTAGVFLPGEERNSLSTPLDPSWPWSPSRP
jgi:hypothetical protein